MATPREKQTNHRKVWGWVSFSTLVAVTHSRFIESAVVQLDDSRKRVKKLRKQGSVV